MVRPLPRPPSLPSTPPTHPAPPTEIPCSALPRFQHLNAICGVLQSALSLYQVHEFFLTTPDPSTSRPVHVGYLLKADDATWFSRFGNGVKVDLVGALTVHLVVTGVIGGLRVESIEFASRGHEEFLAREFVATERVERMFDTGVPEGEDGAEAAGKAAGKKDKAKKPGASTRRRSQTKESEDAEEKEAEIKRGMDERAGWISSVSYENHMLPISPVGSFGITEMGMRCLEVRLRVLPSGGGGS